jgi:hypothetical protein
MIHETLFVGQSGARHTICFSWCELIPPVNRGVLTDVPTSLYCSTLGAITNADSVVYLDLLALYRTSVDNLNYAGAVMLLLLGVGNVFWVPLSNSKTTPKVRRDDLG